MNAVLRSALEYVERGFHVLPVRPDKKPELNLVEATRGIRRWGILREEPAGTAEVEKWNRLDPDAGIAVICQGDLVVVDVDDRDHADAPELPRTPTVETPRGGSHHYLRIDRPIGARFYPWGEVRCAGIYVVAPASRGENGRYRWTVGLHEVERAALPETLRELTRISGEPLLLHRDSLGLTGLSRASLACLDAREDVVHRLLSALGVPGEPPLGKAFHCPLHDDRRPSATLHRGRDGLIRLHCFARCGPGGQAWFPLAAANARQAGRRGRLGRVELALWKLDLLERAELVEPYQVAAPGVPERYELVWAGFLRLLGLRWLTTPGSPAPFARAFAAPWCGLAVHEFRVAFDELRRAGFIRPAGVDAQGLRLWLPCEGVRPLF